MINPRNKIIEMSCAFVLSRAIHTAAIMKIADQFVEKPLTISELAANIKTNLDSLYRFMRFLASYGIFKETKNKTFSLTDLARPLLSNDPNSLQKWLIGHDGYEKRWQAYSHMDCSIKTGNSAFKEMFGQGYFDYIAKDFAEAQKFDDGMSNISEGEEEVLVRSYDFAPYKSIVDVGGGVGRFVAALVQQNPMAICTLYELSHSIETAKKHLTSQHLNKAIQLQEGDFFYAVPSGADLYVLKRILHDWSDEECIKILKNCKNAMRPDSKLLIIECIVPEGNTRDISKDIDIMMMILFGGKERTTAEWHELLKTAGLKLKTIHPTKLMLSIIEVENPGPSY